MAGRDDFEARLRRLEQKAATSEAQALADKPRGKDSTDKRGTPRSGLGPMVPIVLGFVTLFGIGALAAWQYKLSPFEILGDGQMVSVDGWLSGSAPDAAEQGPANPREASRVQTEQGWSFTGSGVANADYSPMIVADIAAGFDQNQPDPAPLGFDVFDANTECSLRNPVEGELLHNIRIERSNADTLAHAFSTQSMVEALDAHIEGVTSGNAENYKIGTMAEGRMAKVDVFVTDTRAPLYLMLQDFRSRTIWNLHLAEGVTLSHVALIGETAAVAGLPDGASVEALRISDFIKTDEFGSNDEIRPCMVVPWRVPQDDWIGLAKAKSGNMLFENQMYSYNAGARAFAAWYQDAMGGWTPYENLVAVNQTAHVLAGPVPDTLVPYTPLSARRAKIIKADHILIGDDALTALHDETLAMAIGGDVAMLDPAPVELEVQAQ
ncbi:MAG: hypothetical protein QNI90_01510 [Dinoroseobacter sp.]|nr:hypothetical protein [Dinoroseobacter sp.]